MIRQISLFEEDFPEDNCIWITDSNIDKIYGNALKKHFKSHLIVLPAGEINKNRAVLNLLIDRLIDVNATKEITLIGFGGGVILDLAGFAAAIFCRGVRLVFIPTTLLGMVDAAIGGKNGVNSPLGKNTLGTFYKPNEILLDLALLNTLPDRELKNGFAEMLKHGIIADKKYFEFLTSQKVQLETRKFEILYQAIVKSIGIKENIVMEDPLENGKRKILNFGHTFAHALETISNFTLSHGSAVAIGMVLESYISYLLGHLSENSFYAIQTTIEKFGFPLTLPQHFDFEILYTLMCKDKKAEYKQPCLVLLEEIGSAKIFEDKYCTFVSKNDLKCAIEWFQSCYASLL